jgi:DNA-directed RNA polymerase subunit RPC12/RpoP
MAATDSGWCPTCKGQRLLLRERPNHILHLILTIVTLGLWANVWVIIAAQKSGAPARCSQCGTQVFVPRRGPVWGEYHGAPKPNECFSVRP